MNKIRYPKGIEYRTPRPRGTIGGAMLEALAGYALTKNSGGALVGGAIGALSNQPLPLHQAVRQTFTEEGMDIVNFYRLGRFAAKVLFRFQNTYWTLESHAPQTSQMALEQIEDWLYGDLIQQLATFLKHDDLRLRP